MQVWAKEDNTGSPGKFSENQLLSSSFHRHWKELSSFAIEGYHEQLQGAISWLVACFPGVYKNYSVSSVLNFVNVAIVAATQN